MTRLLLLTLCSVWLSCYYLTAQQYSVHTFTEQEGLSNSLIKAIVQDSSGFIWSATDGGVLMYNGRSFISITKGLPSVYVKNIFLTSRNELLALTDLGVGYIRKSGDNYYYQPWLAGYSSPTDTSLCYPKEVFEDSQNRIWISDQNSINRIDGNKIRKYRFTDQFRTDSYFRSFMLAQDNNKNLFASSWRGYLFFYNAAADSFCQMNFKPDTRPLYINQLSAAGPNKLLLATDKGLYEIEYSRQFNINSQKRLLNLNSLSSFVVTGRNTFVLGTWNDGLHIWDRSMNSNYPVYLSKSNSVNRLMFDRDGSIWTATDEGLVLLKKNDFAAANYLNNNVTPPTRYIRNVTCDENGTIYFSDQDKIYKVEKTKNGFRYSQFYDSKTARIYSFAVRDDVLWVTHRDGRLIRRKGGNAETVLIHSAADRNSSLALDANGNLWSFLEQHNQVEVFRPDLSREKYTFPKESNYSQLLMIDDNSNVYFLYSDRSFHLFRFNTASHYFDPVPLKSNYSSDDMMLSTDLLMVNEHHGYIASSSGLFEINNGVLTNKAVSKPGQNRVFRSVCNDRKGNLWIGTDRELILDIGTETIQYTQNDGLPTSSTTTGGLAIDNDDRLWVATPGGMGYYQADSLILLRTPAPIILSAYVNGRPVQLTSTAPVFTGSSDVSFIFTCVSFPKRMVFQSRLAGMQKNWSELTTNSEISFYNLPPGNYIFEVKARQAGQLWSGISRIPFTVVPVWYARWYMQIFYFLLSAGFIAFLIFLYQKRRVYRYENENRRLEQLVYEKTLSLQQEKVLTEQLLEDTKQAKVILEKINSDLQKANELKNDLLSITSHDLKNPLSTIMGFSELLNSEELPPEDIQRVHSMIYQSSLRMHRIITELLDSFMLEDTGFRLDMSDVNLVELINKVVAFNDGQAALKNQELTFRYKAHITARVDPKWFAEAIDNLISNAIKYSPAGKDIVVTLDKQDTTTTITIKDEGPGFTDADKLDLFKKFKRLSAKPTGGESSMGLGLSIVREVVQLHGGKIELESQPGQGSKFVIMLQ